MDRIRIDMALEEEKTNAPRGYGSGAAWSLETAGLLGLVVLASALSWAVLRGPVSTETFVRAVARMPRLLVLVLVPLLAAPHLLRAFAPPPASPALAARLLAPFAGLFALLLAAVPFQPPPRQAWASLERTVSSVIGGVPVSGLMVLVLAAATCFALARLVVQRAFGGRAPLAPRDRVALLCVVTALLLTLPASATVFLATGSKWLPIDADELWSPSPGATEPCATTAAPR
ncbi:MAG: hypothetical protein IPG50_35470 [Myxococcales bacterium]|nr:hypothetical protein [Myxococcales bacterium]